MSFLSSLSSNLNLSSSPPTYHPTSLSYLAIFSPTLKPNPISQEENENLSEQDAEERNTSAQLLFYTSRERAVSNQKVSRQLGSATGAIQFADMMALEEKRGERKEGKKQKAKGKGVWKGRSWSIHSSKRRLVLVEVMEDVWIHASIDLPKTGRSNPISTSETNPPSSSSSTSKNNPKDPSSDPITSGTEKEKLKFDYHDEWLRDEWVEEGLRRAWREWRLLNGSPSNLFNSSQGRKSLERSLEKFFSVWVWSWDLEAGGSGSCNSHLNASSARDTFSDTLPAIPVAPLSSKNKISDLITLFKTQAPIDLLGSPLNQREDQISTSIEPDPPILSDLLVLQDTLLLYPPTSASTSTSSIEDQSSTCLSSRDLVDLIRHIVSHLSGLERERDLVRAAAVASSGGGRRKGTNATGGESSGMGNKSIGKGTKKSINHGKNQSISIRGNGIGNGNRRSPNKEGSLNSNREKEREKKQREMELNGGKWSSWGGVWNSIGRGISLGTISGGEVGIASDLNSTRKATQISSQDQAVESKSQDHRTGRENDSAEISAPTTSASKALEASSGSDGAFKKPLPQSLGFGDYITIPDGIGAKRVWSGAEETFKGWGASFGIGSGKEDVQGEETSKKEDEVTQEADSTSKKEEVETIPIQPEIEPEASRPEPQESEINNPSERRDSHTAPNVDLSDLAEAMNDRTPEQEKKQFKEDTANEEPSKELEPLLTSEVETSSNLPTTAISQPTPPIKSFPSLSVTSAAWYTSRLPKDNSSGSSSSVKGFDGSNSSAPTASITTTTQEDLDSEVQSSRGSIKSGSTKTAVSNGGSSKKSHSILKDELLLLGHDHELDGWGDEAPLEFSRLKVFVGGDDRIKSKETDEEDKSSRETSTQLEVLYTTRRLLTIILVLSSNSLATTNSSEPQSHLRDISQMTCNSKSIDSTSSKLLLPCWTLLRRVQRLLNDETRILEKQAENSEIEKTNFLHFSPSESLIQDRLFSNSSLTAIENFGVPISNRSLGQLGDEADAEGQLLSVRQISRRHPYITESFSRSNNGKTWTIFSRSKSSSSSKPSEVSPTTATSISLPPSPTLSSETYLLVNGTRPTSINDADHELRKLAKEFGSFGL